MGRDIDLKEKINIVTREYFGCKPYRLERIKTGLFNTSFILYFKASLDVLRRHYWNDDTKLVMRIAPPDDAGFIFYERNMMWQEPAIHEVLLEKTSIPVPEIIVSDFTRQLLNRDFLIMEYLPGSPLSNVYQHLNLTKLKRVFYQTGEYIAQAHEITYPRQYGYRGRHKPCPTKDTWRDAFYVMWNYLLNDLVDCGAYSIEEANAFRSTLEIYIDLFPKRPSASLLHMDVWSQNILVDDEGNMTGLIDWDRSLTGDPLIEFSVLDYCGILNPAFWNGYGKKLEIDLDQDVCMKFYFLYEHQKYIIINIRRNNNPTKANQYKRESIRILKTIK
ncbi:MAG: phosphotransferase family protein [Promethearchaeota archaeon]